MCQGWLGKLPINTLQHSTQRSMRRPSSCEQHKQAAMSLPACLPTLCLQAALTALPCRLTAVRDAGGQTAHPQLGTSHGVGVGWARPTSRQAGAAMQNRRRRQHGRRSRRMKGSAGMLEATLTCVRLSLERGRVAGAGVAGRGCCGADGGVPDRGRVPAALSKLGGGGVPGGCSAAYRVRKTP